MFGVIAFLFWRRLLVNIISSASIDLINARDALGTGHSCFLRFLKNDVCNSDKENC